MDAASRTGIDDIREIIEGVRYAPVAARYKVYIIDEVHMLSKQAFNGLLKTLEEPPPHVKFVFATTEIRKDDGGWHGGRNGRRYGAECRSLGGRPCRRRPAAPSTACGKGLACGGEWRDQGAVFRGRSGGDGGAGRPDPRLACLDRRAERLEGRR